MASNTVSAPYGWGSESKPEVEEVRKSQPDTSEPEPYETNTDKRRVISAFCATCEETTTLLMEVGDDSPWEHDEKNASHQVEYWREA